MAQNPVAFVCRHCAKKIGETNGKVLILDSISVGRALHFRCNGCKRFAKWFPAEEKIPLTPERKPI